MNDWSGFWERPGTDPGVLAPARVKEQTQASIDPALRLGIAAGGSIERRGSFEVVEAASDRNERLGLALGREKEPAVRPVVHDRVMPVDRQARGKLDSRL